ncbi:MAG: transcriptional repressor NrdR [Firmicutes bacterium]|nr:transcriptional repressor NrdR [Bacillota bacterium]
MKCPFCGDPSTRVIDSRSFEEDTVVRRRRACDACDKRFTTFERVDTIPISVIKNDGTYEPFDRNKIYKGMMRSCNKRPVSSEQLEKATSEIESILSGSIVKEISSKEIGELVMSKLKDIDEIAYVRFASVYRQFKDIDSFMSELSKLLKEKTN